MGIYEASAQSSVRFENKADYCVGTGRIGLALRKDYYEQLKLVQEEIGFKYIRGHGLFCDDMAIYQEHEEDGKIVPEYNFTYLDNVFDMYQSLGIKPFLELGFMPEKLATGTQTIFYWKGNVTPPKDYNAWAELVKATFTHLIERYGEDEVASWPVEIWNEPNLDGFWKDADMQEYFKLFQCTFAAIKEASPRSQAGGPAICGIDDERWMTEFASFCRSIDLEPDFMTRHHYTVHMPEYVGRNGYCELQELEYGLAGLSSSWTAIAKSGFVPSNETIAEKNPAPVPEGAKISKVPMHITEFNTSYSPRTPIHDTNRNAAYVAELLSKLGDYADSYSYWTFGDVFEEAGVAFSQFHGGFGLVTNGLVPKPTFWAFAFFKKLQGECVHREEDVVVTYKDGVFHGIAWNKSLTRTGKKLDISVILESREPWDGEYSLITKTVDEETCNPHKAWHDIGEPKYPSASQLKLLRECAWPQVRTARLIAKDKKVEVSLSIEEFGVVYFEVAKAKVTSDYGFDFDRAIGR
ncbi:MAG: xylan 1,4-beta-xylosidase [Clostridiales bacterium]|nr:xylan 1,4-beta-xylosidase [Clostridiales bacterium]